MSWRGFASGSLVLLFLGTVVQPAASKRVGGLISGLVGFADKFLNPAIAAIPEKGAKPSSSSSAPSLPNSPPATAVPGPATRATAAFLPTPTMSF